MPSLEKHPDAPSSLPRAVLADDHLMVMEGIAELLAEQVQLVALAATGRALVDAIGRTSPDLVITDVNMPHGTFGAHTQLTRPRAARSIRDAWQPPEVAQ